MRGQVNGDASELQSQFNHSVRKIEMKRLRQLLVFLSVLSTAANAAFPEKPIRIIVPYAVGGGADSAARLIALKMSEHLGKAVIVENRPGANAVIGTLAISKAEADGHTIGMVISAHAINPFVVKNLPYDPVKDFESVAYVARMPGVLLVHPSFPAENLPDLVALAKKQPAEFFYAIPGGLTNGHVSMELLKRAASINVTPVTFKGGAPAAMEVVSGRVQMMITAPPASMPFVQSGKLKAIATTGANRLKQLEKVPTFKEAGYSDFETYEWFGIIAPANTPKSIVDRLHEAISLGLKDPAIASRLSGMGLEVVNGGPKELNSMLETEMAKMKVLTQAVKFESE
jgi:tripartite-type tricarboxylate transporter receptor subunit TctC